LASCNNSSEIALGSPVGIVGGVVGAGKAADIFVLISFIFFLISSIFSSRNNCCFALNNSRDFSIYFNSALFLFCSAVCKFKISAASNGCIVAKLAHL
jgi:hypothetical protein